MRKIFHLVWYDIKTHYLYSGMIFVAPIFSIVTLLFLHFIIVSDDTNLLFMLLIWISLCFGTVLSVPTIFNNDIEDGYLHTLLVTGLNEQSIMLAKFIAHWVSTTLPLVILLCIIVSFLNIVTVKLADLIIVLQRLLL